MKFSDTNFNYIYDHFNHLAGRYYTYQNGLNIENPSETVNNIRKISFLECLSKTIDAFVEGTPLEIEEEFQHEVTKELEDMNEFFERNTVNSEEIRQAILLLVIKGYKSEPISVDEITPDVVGLIVANIIDSMFKNELSLRVIDPLAGSGNLCFVVNNYSKLNYNFTLVENNKVLSNLLKSISNLLYMDNSIYLQDTLQYNFNNHDLLICDCDGSEYKNKNYKSELKDKGINYLPYLVIENYLNSEENIDKQIYIVDSDFFSHDDKSYFKNLVLSKAHIDYIITLPLDLFKDKSKQKEIIILSNRSDNKKDTVIYMLPNIKDPKFKDVMNEIKNNIEE